MKELSCPGYVVSYAVCDLYNEVICITNDFGGPKRFVIKAFSCINDGLDQLV